MYTSLWPVVCSLYILHSYFQQQNLFLQVFRWFSEWCRKNHFRFLLECLSENCCHNWMMLSVWCLYFLSLIFQLFSQFHRRQWVQLKSLKLWFLWAIFSSLYCSSLWDRLMYFEEVSLPLLFKKDCPIFPEWYESYVFFVLFPDWVFLSAVSMRFLIQDRNHQ